jgi:DNA-binding protein H-NS
MPKQLTVESQLAKIRKQREALDIREKALRSKGSTKVLDQIVKLAKAADLSINDITKAMATKLTAKSPKKGKLAGKKVAPKYRNPTNAEQTWTGRGVAPSWAQALKSTNSLDTALIGASVEQAGV